MAQSGDRAGSSACGWRRAHRAPIDPFRRPTPGRTNVQALRVIDWSNPATARSRDSPTAPAPSDTLAPPCAAGSTCSTSTRPVFVDQLKRGRKTATIRLGDKTQQVRARPGRLDHGRFPPQPARENLRRVIDDVEVKKVGDLSPRDIEHDNPRVPPARGRGQVPRTDLRPHGRPRRHRHGDPLLADRRATRGALRQRGDAAPQLIGSRAGRVSRPMADYAFLTTWLLDSPREPVWEAIYDQARWPEWWRGVEEVEERDGATAAGSARSRGWSGRACCPTGSSSR